MSILAHALSPHVAKREPDSGERAFERFRLAAVARWRVVARKHHYERTT